MPTPAEFTNQGKSVEMNICRESSFVKAIQKPDIWVNDLLIGEVPNGSNQTFMVPVGSEIVIKMAKNILDGRWSEEVLLRTTVADETQYIGISTNSAWGDAISAVLLAEAVGGTPVLLRNESYWWTVVKVRDSDTFNQICNA